MKFSPNFRTSVIAVLIAGALSFLSFGVNRGIAQNAGQLIFTPTGQELVQVIPPNTAAIAYVSLAAMRDGAQYSFQAPLTGTTIVMAAETSVLSLNPAGTLAALTITMPPTLYDGKIVTIFSSQILTALTLNTSNSATFVPAAPTATTVVNTAYSFIYDKALNQWHRFQ